MITRNQLAARHQTNTTDPRQLGRWVEQTFQGKDGKRLTIITAYRPNYKGNTGPFTVYRQHRDHYNFLTKEAEEANDTEPMDFDEPRQQMLKDLADRFEEIHEAGNLAILLMDCNEDIRSNTMQQFLLQSSLKEVILSRHGRTQAPGTHIHGNKPIDGIFVSHSIQVIACGYTSFDEGVQGRRPDHRCAWMDIAMKSALGYQIPPIPKPQMQRVTQKDPRTVKRFNQHLLQFIEKHKLEQKIFHLEASIHFPPTQEEKEQANQLMALRFTGIKQADRKCRRLHTGEIPYSKEFSQLAAERTFWAYLLDIKRGKKKRQRLLEKYRKQANIYLPLQTLKALEVDSIRERSREAHRKYRRFKEQAAQSRMTWLEELAIARQEEENARAFNRDPNSSRLKSKARKRTGTNNAEGIRRIIRAERIRTMYKRIGNSLKATRLSTNMVIAPNDNGE